MPRGGHCIDQMPARAQHTGKLGLRHRREDVQQKVSPAVPHGGAKAAADTEGCLGHQPGGQPHGLLGEVERCELRTAKGIIKVFVVAALAAAGVHDMAVGQLGTEGGQRLHKRRIVPGGEERAAGADHRLTVAGVGSVLFLHRQQISVALPCKVKAVRFGAAQGARIQQQRPAADRAAQRCRCGGGHSAAGAAGAAVSGVSIFSGGRGTVMPPWAAR